MKITGSIPVRATILSALFERCSPATSAYLKGAILSFASQHLISGETVQYETRLHWIVMSGHALAAAILEILAFAFLVGSRPSGKGVHASPANTLLLWAALFCFLVGGILFSVGLIRRNATEMAVTNRRVIVKSGLAERRTIELLLSRIESVVVEESALGRLLGYGTVIVRGTGGTPEIFPKIARPLEFREQVQRQIAGGAK